MASAYTPPAGSIEVVDGFTNVKKMPLPTTPRSFPLGAPMWNNGASGIEPSLQQAGDATSVEHANGVFAPLFVGFALEARVPQQLNTLGEYSAPGNAAVAPDDASRPFISVADSGIAVAPCAALGGQHEIGEFVDLAGFTNEASVGFYTPAGVLTKDTNNYLYLNQVQITATAANAIGILCERALAGQTYLRFKFGAQVLNTSQVG